MNHLLDVGQPFPDFALGEFDTLSSREGRPVLAIIWRTGCSTCRFSMPFFDRLHQAYPKALIVGISQDTDSETQAYCAENDITMQQHIDEELVVTRRFGIKTVPAYVLADSKGIIRLSGFSWSRENVEEISSLLAQMTDLPSRRIVLEQEQVPNFKPG